MDAIKAICKFWDEEWHTCITKGDKEKVFQKQLASLATQSFRAKQTVVVKCDEENLPDEVEHQCAEEGEDFTTYTFESLAIHALDMQFEIVEICFA